jgi:hypothetical protein
LRAHVLTDAAKYIDRGAHLVKPAKLALQEILASIRRSPR